MTEGDIVTWLVQEISDLLDAGSVGLYEFIDELTDPAQPRTPEERQALARQALDRLLAQGGIEFQQRHWADFDNVETVAFQDLPADPWNPPGGDGRYFAIMRSDWTG